MKYSYAIINELLFLTLFKTNLHFNKNPEHQSLLCYNPLTPYL
jgi:hypothetical protein